jgi:hypothetical protein
MLWNLLWRSSPSNIQEIILIGKVEPLNENDKVILKMNTELRTIIIKYCDTEIAKNTGSLTNSNLTIEQVRHTQGHISWLYTVRNYLKNI